MARFEIPKAVAEINVLKLDGSVTTERYNDINDFFAALVRANLKNKRKTYKDFGQLEIQDGYITVWVVIQSNETEDTEE